MSQKMLKSAVELLPMNIFFKLKCQNSYATLLDVNILNCKFEHESCTIWILDCTAAMVSHEKITYYNLIFSLFGHTHTHCLILGLDIFLSFTIAILLISLI